MYTDELTTVGFLTGLYQLRTRSLVPPRGSARDRFSPQRHRMITVAGEALIDLIVDPAGHIDPRFGGGPFNVARAVARLGQPAAFLGRLSGDRFGRLLRGDLDRHGVQLVIEAPADAPSTLAGVD